jgi:hypothetical protein
MAYVPGVKNDLFISYAHVDNERDAHGIRWVSEFVRGFTVELRQRLGGPKEFTPFFDESDLHAHHHLQVLLENARQSAIFVAVLSPSYVSHDWTMRELVEFAGIASDSRRIIVVEKLPLEIGDDYPAEIENHKRTQFWRTNEPESYTPSTLTANGQPAEYRTRLENLADQVQRLMRDMRRAAQAPAPLQTAAPAAKREASPPPPAPAPPPAPKREAAPAAPPSLQPPPRKRADAPPRDPLSDLLEQALTPQDRTLITALWPATKRFDYIVTITILAALIAPTFLWTMKFLIDHGYLGGTP